MSVRLNVLLLTVTLSSAAILCAPVHSQDLSVNQNLNQEVKPIDASTHVEAQERSPELSRGTGEPPTPYSRWIYSSGDKASLNLFRPAQASTKSGRNPGSPTADDANLGKSDQESSRASIPFGDRLDRSTKAHQMKAITPQLLEPPQSDAFSTSFLERPLQRTPAISALAIPFGNAPFPSGQERTTRKPRKDHLQGSADQSRPTPSLEIPPPKKN